MPVAPEQVEIVANKLVEGYEWLNRKPGEMAYPQVSNALRAATRELFAHLSPQLAPSEVLLDVNHSFSYRIAITTKVTVTLLVATNHRLWVARHDDGVPTVSPIDYAAIITETKRLTVSTKVEQEAGGYRITASSAVVEWLEALKVQRPPGPVEWLAPRPAPAGWHPDPFGRFDLRYWDGARWTEHVSTGGAQGTDAPA